ncbi:uncharacterized protein LOC129585980 isoform X2 [Paramacrobiotus metropolitanus]|uniref:uncharacterized protein LOC129585980 isoform X2 n=1 Tax=Paramacrobiotus metropolitanus TaxID=2943436 RepID=UPI0024459AC5|nr:uncharacterized protein LOC129585980 isoform X2 [Paramacrobiotus metropolitanus]
MPAATGYRGFPFSGTMDLDCKISLVAGFCGMDCSRNMSFSKKSGEPPPRIGNTVAVRAHNLAVDEHTHRVMLSYWLPDSNGSYPADKTSQEMHDFYSGQRQEHNRCARYRFKNDDAVAVDRGSCFEAHLRWTRGIFRGFSAHNCLVYLLDCGYEGVFPNNSIFPLHARFLKDPVYLAQSAVNQLDDTDVGGSICQSLLIQLRHPKNEIMIKFVRADPETVDVLINRHELGLFVWMEQRLLSGYTVADGFRLDVGTVVYAPNGRKVYVVPHKNWHCMQNVHNVVKQDVSRNLPPDLSIDAVNAVTYTDGLDYRGVITGIKAKKYTVRLIEYGNEFEVKADFISGLSLAAQCIESPVIQCQLADIPEDKLGDQTVVEWLLKFLKSGNSGEKSCVYEISRKSEEIAVIKIKLWRDNGEDSSAISVHDWFHSKQNSDDSGMWSPQRSEAEKCQLQTGYQKRFDDMAEGATYNIGDTISVRTCTVIDPENVTLYSDNPNFELYYEMAMEIENVVDHLPELDALPPNGTVICARYSLDEKWYRAFIIECDSAVRTAAWVGFVDYGNIELVQKKDMKPLTESLARYPRMCFTAKINGIQPPRRSHYTTEHTKIAKKKLMGKPCMFRILSIDGRIVTGDLFLEDSKTGDRTTVADIFVEAGIAAACH